MKQLYIINERGPKFWNNRTIGSETTYGMYIGEGKHVVIDPAEFDQVIDNLKDKRVLVYIHGLKNTKECLCTNYDLLKNHIAPLTLNESYYHKFKRVLSYYLGYRDSCESPAPYDVIIGYSWPSFDHESYYFQAKDYAIKLAPKLSNQLLKLSKSTNKIDVMAHSMGNLLLFEALSNKQESEIKIDHIYSIAAAVPDDSLHSKYAKVVNYCEQLFVFHSKHDFALSWPFFFAENNTNALGYLGPKKVYHKKLHPKVKIIDSSDTIKGHSDYFFNDAFYEYLLKIHNQELDLSQSHFQIESDLIQAI